MRGLLSGKLIVAVGFLFFLSLQQAFAQSLRGNIETKCENLTFSELNLAPGEFDDDIKVLGRVTNNSTQMLENVLIIAEFYDRNGRLADVNEDFPSIANLGPGDSSPFEVEASGVAAVNESGIVKITCGAIIP